MTRVLAFTPTWDDAMRPECRATMEAQRIDGELEWVVSTDNPYPIGDMRNVLHQFQKARQMALDGGFDALLTFEHDHQLPMTDSVQRLVDTEGDVIYGVYVLRHGKRLFSAWKYDNDRNVGMSLSNYPRELVLARKAGAWRVSGIGMGCTLFRRHVLEAIPFRDEGMPCAPDLPFADDALHAHYVSMARFDVPVGHYCGDGVWLWPVGVDGMTKDKYTATEDINVMVDGRVVKMQRGETYEFNSDEADDLIKMGVVYLAEGPVARAAPPIEEAVIAPPETTEAPANRRKGRKAQ